MLREISVAAGRIVLDGWPHGFGSDGVWVSDYATWLDAVFTQKGDKQ